MALGQYKISPDKVIKLLDSQKLAKMREDGISLQEELGVSAEALALYYSVGNQFLQECKWCDARDVFRFLTFLNPYVQSFWVGLGIAEQSVAKFSEAIDLYAMAQAIDPYDPIPFANAFQCNIALNEYEYANEMWQKAIKCCGNLTDYEELKQKLLAFKQN